MGGARVSVLFSPVTAYCTVTRTRRVTRPMPCTGVIVDCTGVIVHCTGVIVHCTGVIVHCTGVIADCTGVLVDCTGVIVDCTGVIAHCTGKIVYCTGVIAHCTGGYIRITFVSPWSTTRMRRVEGIFTGSHAKFSPLQRK